MMVTNAAQSSHPQKRIGRLARLRGVDIQDNPHAPCTPDWGAWQDGWIQADADLQRRNLEVKNDVIARRKREAGEVRP